MFTIRFLTRTLTPPQHTVTVRTDADWSADVEGSYSRGAWTFELGEEHAGAKEFKLFVDGAPSGAGESVLIEAGAQGVDLTDDDVALGGIAAGVAGTNGAAGTAPAPPPLMVFNPLGPASVINYALPEAMSYRGRHVLDLGYKGADFADLLAVVGGAPALEAGRSAETRVAQPMPRVLVATATTTANATAAIAAPSAVVLSAYAGESDAAKKVVQLAPFQLSERLASLTWGDVQQVAAIGKRIDIHRSLGGLLDYRVRIAPRPPSLPASAAGDAGIVALARIAGGGDRDGGSDGGGTADPPELGVVIESPDHSNPQLTGTGDSYLLTVTGSVGWFKTPYPSVMVQLDDAPSIAATVTAKRFTAQVTLAAGQHTMEAVAKAGRLTDRDTVSVNVTLGGGGGGPKPAPTVTISSPSSSSIVVSTSSIAAINVSGSVDANGGGTPTVTLTASGSKTPSAKPNVGLDGAWVQAVELDGYGVHTITASATNTEGEKSPDVSIAVDVVAKQPANPIERRLFLIETIAISSFLGDCGAGRLLKTFSLLPGEKTTISIDSYRKDDSTAKTASSILDSAASESAADFEDTINEEQDRKSTDASSRSFTLAASAGASWGFGSADIKASYGSTANSSRDEMSKNVRNALQKHAMKASTNRSVSVNTEYTQTTSTGNTEDTKRELSNINVSRVLNFVFRQMVQEHVALVHLIDAKIGYYQQDLLLNADGSPGEIQESYAEYTLPEFGALAEKVLAGGAAAAQKAQQALLALLSAVPNVNGELKPLIEEFTPTLNGVPQPDQAYLRVIPNLLDKWSPAGSNRSYSVPGVGLTGETIVMRTDGVLVDALLGQGVALDDFATRMQEATVAARRLDTAAQQVQVDKDKLAATLVKTKDADGAKIFTEVFPTDATESLALTTVAGSPDGGTR